jgi:hypothetical protein
MSQDTDYLRSNYSIWQSERCKKHRARFHTGSQKCKLLTRREIKEHNDTNANKNKESFIDNPTIEQECETKRVSLDPRVPNKTIMISQDLSPSEESKLLSFLDKNSDVFT